MDDRGKKHLSHYEEFDGGFIAQSDVPVDSESFTLFAFNENKLGKVFAVPC